MIVLALAIGVSAALADPVLAQQCSITMPHAGGITKPAAGGITTPAEDIALYLPMVSGGAGISGEYFATLPPGSVLPGGAVCATRVQSRPENKGDNQAYNSTPGNQGIPADFFPSGSFDPRANTQIMVRVDGEFTRGKSRAKCRASSA